MLSGGFRKLARVAVLAVTAGLLWAVAPALSTTPFVPRAVDFDQPLGDLVKRAGRSARAANSGEGKHGEGPVRFRTQPIHAPRRFDMVGVARHLEDLEYRTRRDGEAWSAWVEAPDGSPVWAGGADWVQVRSRGARFSGRLHYVNVTGTETPLQRLLTGVRSAVSSVVVGAFGTDQAAAARGIRYVPRSAWGADRKVGGCLPRAKPSFGKVKLAAVHHTVSTNEYSPEMGPSIVLGICRYHRNANGWNDVGYNALVDRFGVLYEGRAGGLGGAVIGAHAAGWNSLSSGVALIGTHTVDRPSKPAVAKLVKWLAWKLDNHGWTKATGRRRIRSLGGSLNRHPKGKRVRLSRVTTHRHLNSTQCAGDGTEPLMKRIRRRIQNTIERWDGEGPALVPTEGASPAPLPPPDDGGTPPGDSDGSSGGTGTTTTTIPSP